MCLAQSQGDADRFSALGSPHVFNTGNLKFDVPAPPADPQKLEQLTAGGAGTSGGARVLDASGRGRGRARRASPSGGVFPGAADDHRAASSRARPTGRAAHRKPRRLRAALRSQGRAAVGRRPRSMSPTRWANSGCSIACAPIVFVGGSLVNHGGQNPIEPIKLGAAVLHGPHVGNFAEIYRALDEAGGARLADNGEALVKQIGGWLDDRRRAPARERGGPRGRRSPRRRAGPDDGRAGALSAAAAARKRDARMREPAFWWRSPSWMSRRARASRFCSTERSPAAACGSAGHRAAVPGHLRRQLLARRRRQDADSHCAGEAAARCRRNAGGAQPRLWRQARGSCARGRGAAHGGRRRR